MSCDGQVSAAPFAVKLLEAEDLRPRNWRVWDLGHGIRAQEVYDCFA